MAGHIPTSVAIALHETFCVCSGTDFTCFHVVFICHQCRGSTTSGPVRLFLAILNGIHQSVNSFI